MVADQQTVERFGASQRQQPVWNGLRLRSRMRLAFVIGLVLNLAVVSACVSRGGSSKEFRRVRELVAHSPQPDPGAAGDERPWSRAGHDLHVAGLVECGGFISKTQAAYGAAWVTKTGEGPARVKVPQIDLTLVYRRGLFRGLSKKHTVRDRPISRVSEVVHGNFSTDLRSCVFFSAEAKVPPRDERVRASIEVCPQP